MKSDWSAIKAKLNRENKATLIHLIEELTAVSLFRIVARYGKRVGKPTLAPHDLRRTYAQLGYEAGVPVTQISILLGHASIETTRRYLNLELDLQTTVSDFVPYERANLGYKV